MPRICTVFRWLRSHPDFRDQYAHARDEQAETFADEIIEISDDGTNDWIEKRNRDGEIIGYTVNGEAVQRSKLRVDARKWIAAQMKPKKYGSAAQANATGEQAATDFTVRNALSPGVK
jgi:hypothetical protein